MERFAKNNETRAERGVWWFVEIGHFDKHFKNMSKTQEKETHKETFWKFFP